MMILEKQNYIINHAEKMTASGSGVFGGGGWQMIEIVEVLLHAVKTFNP